MKRGEFLKKLAIGAGVAVVTPVVLMAEKKPEGKEEPVSLAIDVLSISGITAGGQHLNPAEILAIWRQTGMLLYTSRDGRGNPCNAPMVIQGKIEAVDITKLK
jgi:hypothetical protein